MEEDVLVAATFYCFNSAQGGDLGQYEFHEAAFEHQLEAHGWSVGEHNLVELHSHALGRDYLYAFGVARDGLEGVVCYAEAQL